MGFLGQITALLQNPDYRVATYSAFLGAIFGVVFTLIFSFLGRKLQNFTANRAIRSQISSVAEANKVRLNLNIGIVSNELKNLTPMSDTKFTLNPLASIMVYQHNVFELNTSLATNEKYIINLQITALNAHQSQVENLISCRTILETEIRKSQHREQEAELIALRLDYDHYLKEKYLELIQYTDALLGFVNQKTWRRLLVNIVPLKCLTKVITVQDG